MRTDSQALRGTRAAALAFVFTLLTNTSSFAAELVGTVIKVADGDTVTVLVDGRKERVRHAGIDAPERQQRHGKASGVFMRALTLNRTVRVTYEKRDRYKRIVGVVWTSMPDCQGDCPLNLDAGLAAVRLGHAWHFKRYQHEQSPDDRVRYDRAESLAREERVGLWTWANPMPPWEWRRRKK